MCGARQRPIRVGLVGVDDRATSTLRAAVDRNADADDLVLSDEDGDEDVDCVLVASPSAEGVDDVADRVGGGGPPVVVVHDDATDRGTIDRLTAAGVADVVSRSNLDAECGLLVHRILTLARAHRVRTRATVAPPTAGARTAPRDGDRGGSSIPAVAGVDRATGSQASGGDATTPAPERDREFLYTFHDVATTPAAAFEEQVSSLLELCCETLGFDVGLLSRVSDENYEIRAVHAPGEHIAVGDVFDLEETYCELVVDTASVQWFLDAEAGAVEDSPAYRSTGYESYLGLPVRVDGDLYGTLCLAGADDRDRTIGDDDVALVRHVAEWVGSELLRARRERQLRRVTARFESVVEAIPLAIVGLDEERTVTHWNAGAEAMFGWEAAEVLDGDYPLIPDAEVESAADLLDRLFDGDTFRGIEIRRETRAGEVRDLRLSTAPMRGCGGEVEEVIGIMDDVTDRREFERKLRALQTTTSRLNLAADVDDIGQLAVDAATDVLGYPLTTLWLYDEGADALVPSARSEVAHERIGALPRFGPGDGRLWDVFEEGEHLRYDDLGALDDRYEGIRSGIAVPLGEHGVLGAGTAEDGRYDERDLELVHILAAAVEAALTRADRERRLRETNQRLDEFASVAAHDLRSPLTTAVGYVEVARETGDHDHFDRVEDAHGRMSDLIDDLLTLARNEDRALERREASLDEVVTDAWSYVRTDGERLLFDDLGRVECDPDQLGRLFQNLFRNAVEHGDADAVRVERLADGGFAVEDDGTGFDASAPENPFERGHHSSNGGVGYGLTIVADVASAHGWSVERATATAGGARFEVRPR